MKATSSIIFWIHVRIKKKKTKRKTSWRDGSTVTCARCLSRGPSAAPNIDSKQLTASETPAPGNPVSLSGLHSTTYTCTHTNTQAHTHINKDKNFKKEKPTRKQRMSEWFFYTVSRQVERTQGFSMLKEQVLFLNCTTLVHCQFPHTWESLDQGR